MGLKLAPRFTSKVSESKALEKLSFNMSSDTASRCYQVTLRYVIYKIVSANKGITYVNLKKILHGEYGYDKRLLDAAINSLTSKNMFDGLDKWRNPKCQDVGAEIGIHLFAKETPSPRFSSWIGEAEMEFPELKEFVAPVRKSLEEQSTTTMRSSNNN